MMLKIRPVTKTSISKPKALNLIEVDSAFQDFDPDEMEMRCIC